MAGIETIVFSIFFPLGAVSLVHFSFRSEVVFMLFSFFFVR